MRSVLLGAAALGFGALGWWMLGIPSHSLEISDHPGALSLAGEGTPFTVAWSGGARDTAVISSSSGRSIEALTHRLEELEHEVGSLREEVHRLRARQGTLDPSDPQASGKARDDLEASARGERDPDERARKEVARDIARFEQRLATEAIDPGWTAPSELEDATRTGQLPGAVLLEAACATSICRARFQQNDPLTRDDFVEAIAETPPMNSQVFVTTSEDEDGKLEAVVYFSRPDRDLFTSD